MNRLCFPVIIALILAFSVSASAQLTQAKRWYKGNTHAHTLKSDGDSTPEEVAKWYKENGYNFLFITDHETITPVQELNREFGVAGEAVAYDVEQLAREIHLRKTWRKTSC